MGSLGAPRCASVRLGAPRWSRLFVEPSVLPQLARRCGIRVRRTAWPQRPHRGRSEV